MANIGLIIRPGVPRAVELGSELIARTKREHSVLCESETAVMLGIAGGISAEELVAKADPIVTLGGDGTLIGAARLVRGRSPVMLGVNFGTLGFLTETAPEELFAILEAALSGEAELGERIMLAVSVTRGERTEFTCQAVNDAVVQKEASAPLLELDLRVGAEELMRVRSDGIIVSTPTGSTAYGLSAGGAIIEPSLSVISVAAMCPHSLTFRPLVLPFDVELSIGVPAYRGAVVLHVDGQDSFSLQPGDRVGITKSKHTVKFVRSPNRTYFEILRRKLNWGIGNQG